MLKIVTVTKFVVERRYGFADDNNQNRVFFYYYRSVTFKNDGGDDPFRQPFEVPFPKKDDILIVDTEMSERGERAIWWGYYEDYQKVKNELNQRLKFRMIQRRGRVKLTRLHNPDDAQYNTLWEGVNLRQLRNDRHLQRQKPLDHEFEGLHFEVETPEGWKKCPDPRE